LIKFILDEFIGAEKIDYHGNSWRVINEKNIIAHYV